MPYRLIKRLGLEGMISRRDFVLALIGVAWVFIGLSKMFGHPTPEPGVWHDELISQDIQGILWMVTAAIAFWAAGRHGRDDTVGFVAVCTMPCVYAVSNLVSWLTWLLPGASGNVDSFYRFIVWASSTTILAVIASWPEYRSGVTGGDLPDAE